MQPQQKSLRSIKILKRAITAFSTQGTLQNALNHNTYIKRTAILLKTRSENSAYSKLDIQLLQLCNVESMFPHINSSCVQSHTNTQYTTKSRFGSFSCVMFQVIKCVVFLSAFHHHHHHQQPNILTSHQLVYPSLYFAVSSEL